MAKFKLEVKPTFKTNINMPVHGGDTVDLEFEFKHRTRDQLSEWVKTFAKLSDPDMIEAIVVGWSIDDPFNRESIELLCQNYAGAPKVILESYLQEIRQAREKN